MTAMIQSTMTRLRDERDSLRLRLKLRDCIYWPALLIVIGVAIYVYWRA